MQIEHALGRADKWMVTQHSLVDGSTFEASRRRSVGIALLDVCVKHQQGVLVLAGSKLYASMLALLRPQLEACVRGVWVLRRATEEQIGDFADGGEPPRISNLLADVESLPEYQDKVLSSIKSGSWRRFCDYSHSGIIQAKGRMSGYDLADNYNPQYVALALDASAMLSMLASCEIVQQTDRQDAVGKIRSSFEELYGATV